VVLFFSRALFANETVTVTDCGVDAICGTDDDMIEGGITTTAGTGIPVSLSFSIASFALSGRVYQVSIDAMGFSFEFTYGCLTANVVTGPDAASWTFSVDVPLAAVGSYQVCFRDTKDESFTLIPAATGAKYLEVVKLSADSTHPRGVFHNQFFSTLTDASFLGTFTVAGTRLPVPSDSKVLITAGKCADPSTFSFAGTVTPTASTDVAAPQMVVAENVPANGATVGAITSMAIAFDEPITSKGCSPGTNVTLMEVGSMYGLGFACANLTIEDDRIILAFGPLGPGTYMVRVDTGAVSDLNGNVVTMISSASTYTFTVGTSTAPATVLYSDPPMDGKLSKATMDFQYTLDVVAAADGFIELYSCGSDFVCGADDQLMYRYAATSVTVSYGLVSVDVSALGETYGRWKAVIPAGTFTEGGVAADALTLEFVNDYSDFDYDLVVKADAAASTADGLVFEALYSGVAPGTYSLCYCSDQLDETLEEMGDYETTYKLKDDNKQSANLAKTDAAVTAAKLSDKDLTTFECHNECSMGCTGPDCYCDGYKTAVLDGTYFCLPPSLCRDACDAVGSACVGISVHDTLPQCLLATSTTLGVANVDEAWSFFEKKSGTACSQLSDFGQTAGSFAVTARPDIAVDYVVTPGEDVSIEVTASGARELTYATSRKLLSEDRITIIDSLGTCGLSSPSSSVEGGDFDAGSIAEWAALEPFSYFRDLPSEDLPGLGPNQPDADKVVLTAGAGPPSLYVPRAKGSYCKDQNIDLSGVQIPFGGAFVDLETHQCYKKCSSPCVGDYCDPECNGYYSGYDDATSNALCVQADFCKYICDNVEGCESIDMHNTLPRCFLNSDGCVNEDDIAYAADGSYTLHIRASDANQEATRLLGDEDGAEAAARRLKPKRTVTPAPTPAPTMVFSYDNLPVHYSWSNMLRFKSFSFTSGGTFKVCFCDSTLLSKGSVCASEADFSVQVGTVHSSGVSCLLEKPALQRVSCVPQMYGGLRCYAKYTAPEPVLPPPEVIFGAVKVEDMTPEMLSTYCLMRPEEDVCVGITPTPP